MINLRQNFFLIRVFVVILTLFVSSFSAQAVENEQSQNIEQSILIRYQQKLVGSFDYYLEKLGLQGYDATPVRMDYYPVLMGNNKTRISRQDFHTELFFSRLHEMKLASPTKAVDKVIKISNIPVRDGALSSRFGFRKDPFHGLRRMHNGIDISAKYGSTVNPLGKGVVVFAGYKFGFGNTVEIKHGKSVLSRYAHLKQFLVDTGQPVNIDDKIGLVGSSGRSTGPHLHLEVLINDKQVDPQIFLVNHFGNRSNSSLVAKVKTKEKVRTKIIKNSPLVKSFPQVSYQEYVESIDGQFGFSAPAASMQ